MIYNLQQKLRHIDKHIKPLQLCSKKTRLRRSRALREEGDGVDEAEGAQQEVLDVVVAEEEARPTPHTLRTRTPLMGGD